MRRRIRVAAATTALALIAGCTSVDGGLGVRDPEFDPLSVNAALLESGSFATEPTPLGNAGTYDTGRQVESVRLSEYLVSPFEAVPSLIATPDVDDGQGGVVPGMKNSRLNDLFGGIKMPNAINDDDLVAGFGIKNQADARSLSSHTVSTILLRFRTPEQAQANADALLVSGRSLDSETEPAPREIPAHPNTQATLVRGIDSPDQTFLVAVTVHGDLVLLQTVRGTGRSVDLIGTGENQVAKILDLQVPLLTEYQPTPLDKLTELPQDPTGLLSRTVPIADKSAAGNAGTYGPRGSLAFQR